MGTVRAYLVVASMALLFLAIGLDTRPHRSIAEDVEIVAHAGGAAQREYDELLALGAAGRNTYDRLLSSSDKDVRWTSAVFLSKLENVSDDLAARRYLLAAGDRDVAAMMLLRSICDERSERADSLVARLLGENPRLSPLIAQFLMSKKRDDDRRFRAFVASQTSSGALYSLQRGLEYLHPCKRHAELIAIIARRLETLRA